MEHLCTTCCKRKRRDEGSLPAMQRYLSGRIRFVHGESLRLAVPLLLLSGRFGLLKPDDRIPWYDERLSYDKAHKLVPFIANQLNEYGVTAIAFYARPRLTSGWGPYYDVLERACQSGKIPMRIELLGEEYL